MTRIKKFSPIILGIFFSAILICLLLFSGSCRYIKGYRRYRSIKSEMRSPRVFGKAHLDIYDRVPILHLYGSPREMGKQYGVLLKQPLQDLFALTGLFIDDKYKKQVIAQAGKIEPNLPENFRQELKAIAETAEIPYMELVAVNVTPRLMCSGLAVWGKNTASHEMIMGRNSDYPSFHLEEVLGLIVVYHPDKGLPVVSINFLGMIGAFTGMNSKGVSFGNMLVFNALWQHDQINFKGLPIQLLLRNTAHQSENTGNFISYLEKQKHLIPMNVMVADSSSAKVAELANGEALIRDGKGENFLAVSNYFSKENQYAIAPSCKRYEALVNAVKANPGKFNVDTMKQALNKAKMKDLNIQAVIFEPAKKLLYVSINKEPAAEGPYITFSLDKLIKDTKPDVCQD